MYQQSPKSKAKRKSNGYCIRSGQGRRLAFDVKIGLGLAHHVLRWLNRRFMRLCVCLFSMALGAITNERNR